MFQLNTQGVNQLGQCKVKNFSHYCMAIGIKETFRVSNGHAAPMFKVIVAGCIMFLSNVGNLLHHCTLYETQTPQHYSMSTAMKIRNLADFHSQCTFRSLQFDAGLVRWVE